MPNFIFQIVPVVAVPEFKGLKQFALLHKSTNGPVKSLQILYFFFNLFSCLFDVLVRVPFYDLVLLVNHFKYFLDVIVDAVEVQAAMKNF